MAERPLFIYEFEDSNPDGPWIVLSYANGFPPQTYREAFRTLFPDYHILSPHLRPMWVPPPEPKTLTHWRVLADDLLHRLDRLTKQPVIGVGHSVGAAATLYAAVKEPERFSHLVLIDPTMMPRSTLAAFWLMRRLGRGTRLPIIQQALRRGRQWPSLDAAYTYFRGKKLFTTWSDAQVHIYTESMTGPDDDPANPNGLKLMYPPVWEAQIYKTLPTDVWQLPGKLKTPTLVIRGEHTDVFVEASARLFQRRAPTAKIVTISGAGHLIPQERPDETGILMRDFLVTA